MGCWPWTASPFASDEGETVSVIGPNGAGKTTLFNLITGLDRPTQGDIFFAGASLTGLRPDEFAARGIARTFQHGRVFGNLSVLDNVLIGAHRAPAGRARPCPWLGACTRAAQCVGATCRSPK